MDRIGVRELRQHASRYLARVASGESLEVTDRGRPVAMLVPVRGDEWQHLLASGRVVVVLISTNPTAPSSKSITTRAKSSQSLDQTFPRSCPNTRTGLAGHISRQI